jgi:hypothetical protein
MKIPYSLLLLSIIFFAACSENKKTNNNSTTQKEIQIKQALFPVSTDITELTDKDYPDNPDMSIRSFLDGQYSHKDVVISQKEEGFTFVFTPNNNKSDTLIVSGINIMEFMPSCPSYVSNDYMKFIGIVNQEWNRQQVKFFEFEVKGNNGEQKVVKRIDIARNCLNAYLWEIIAYTEEEEKLKPYYHGWFSFPKEQYAALFEQRNDLKWADYENSLVGWIDPKNESLDLDQLRTIISQKEVSFVNMNDGYFPVKGERKKKEINIIIPKKHTSINDFLTDSTQFSTFSPPGFYNTSDPRTTELGRLNNPQTISYAESTSKNKAANKTFELIVSFNDTIKNRKTSFVIGGLNKKNIPTLAISDINKGFQMPMGISNHSFYETYDVMSSSLANQNPYYSFLINGDNKWLDSHKVGIDGPLLHYDKEGKLHLWILSFERHAFVGHYIIEVD